MPSRSTVVKRSLFVLVASLAIFVGWRVVTLPDVAARVELDAPTRAAGLVADRLPLAKPTDAPSGDRVAADTVVEGSQRALDGWLAGRSLALEARCVDVDGTPLADVDVVVSQAGMESSAVSDADGRVRIDRNVAWIDWGLTIEAFVFGEQRRRVELFDDGAMQVRVVARRSGYASVETWPRVVLGETVQAGELVLVPAGTLTGRVVDEAGTPVANATISASVVQVARTRERSGHRGGARSGGIVVSSDASGRFVADDAPAGTLALHALDVSGRRGEQRRVQVRAAETTDVEIVVAVPASTASVIAGRVLSSDGAPVAQAVVVTRVGGEDGDSEQRLPTDGQGSFRFEMSGGGRIAVEAWDRRGIHGQARVDDVAPDTLDLVLRLDAARHLTLDVVGADGSRLEDYGASVHVQQSADNDPRMIELVKGDEPTGPLYTTLDVAGGRPDSKRIAIPRTPFVVRVASSGLRVRTLGPFDPDTVPDVLRVELAPTHGLRGRVLRDGAPVVGAQVRLCTPLAGGATWMRDGFPSRYRDTPPLARTDREGRFVLGFDVPEGTRVRAEAPGSAPNETAPLTFDETNASTEVEIVLTRGGDLEGRVVVDAGVDPAGIVIGISRGDGFARTQRTDRDGRFRFEYLTPGAWFVHEHDDEIRPGSWTSNNETFGPEHVWPTNAHVVEGRTTYVDVDLREPASLRFEGRAFTDGRALAGWNATLTSDAYSPRTLQREIARTTVADDGRFELVVHEPGPHRLVLREDEHARVTRTIEAAVRIDGPTTNWDCEFETGTLAGIAPRDRVRLRHIARTATGALVSTPIVPDAGGRYRIERVIHGAGSIVAEPTRRSDVDLASWPVLRSVDVPRGGVVEIDLR